MKHFRHLSALIAGWLLGTATAGAQLYVSEINFNPIGDQKNEWIEIYNHDTVQVSLQGWVLTDNEFTFTFPNVDLDADARIIIHIGTGVDSATDLYMGYSTGQLNNAGDDLALRDDGGTWIDYVAYGGQAPSVPAGLTWTNNISTTGASPGQTLAFTGTSAAQQDNGNNWALATASPNKPNTAPTATIRINEVQPTGDEFIELYYSGTGNLSDYYVQTVNGGVGGGSGSLRMPTYNFSGTGYIVLYMDELGVGAPVNAIALESGDTDAIAATDEIRIYAIYNDSRQDGVAIGTSMGGGFSFSPPISTTPYTSGDSFAWLETSGTSADNGQQWINRTGAHITPGTANTEQPAPAIAIGDPTPASGFAECGEATFPLSFTYSDEAYLRGVTVTLDLDQVTAVGGAMLYGGLAGGETGSAYSSATNTITWQIGDLPGDRADLAFTLRPGLGVTSFTIPPEAVTLSYKRWATQATAATVAPPTGKGPYSVTAPDLTMTLAEWDSGDNPYLTDAGQYVDLRLRVSNAAGVGGLADAPIQLDFGDDLRLVTVKVGDASGGAPHLFSETPASNTASWTVQTLAAGASVDYYVRLQVLARQDIDVLATLSRGCAASGGTPTYTPDKTAELRMYTPVQLSVLMPGDDLSACQDFPVTFYISNSNSVPAQLGNLTLTLPEHLFLIAAYSGDAVNPALELDIDTDVTYTGVASGGVKTLSVAATTLVPSNVGAPDTLPAATGTGDSATPSTTEVTFVFRSNCEPLSDRTFIISQPYTTGVFSGTRTGETPGVTLRKPALSISIVDPTDASLTSTTVLATVGDEVNFLLRVSNNGAGDLDFDSPESFAKMELTGIDANLDLRVVGVYTGAPSADPAHVNDVPNPANAVTVVDDGDADPNDVPWYTGPIAAGAYVDYTLRVRVTGCESLSLGAQASYNCSGRPDRPVDSCSVPPTASTSAASSVELTLDSPNVQITVPATYTVDYCDDPLTASAADFIEIEVRNSGEGYAKDVEAIVTGFDLANYDLQVADAAFEADYDAANGGGAFAALGVGMSDYTVDIVGNTASFTLVNGADLDSDGHDNDLAGDTPSYIRFHLSQKGGGAGCAATASGAATVDLTFLDPCGLDWADSVLPATIAWSRAARPGSVGVTNGGADVVPGTAGSWTVNVAYVGPPDGTADYDLTIEIPNETQDGAFARFTMDGVLRGVTPLSSPADYTYNAATGTITIPVTSTFDASGIYSQTFTVNYTAAANVCGTYSVDSTAVITNPVDCRGCAISDTLTGSHAVSVSPPVSLTLTGPASLASGGSGTMSAQLVYTGLPGEPFSADIDVTYPAGHTIDGGSLPAGGSVDAGNRIVSWPVSGTFDADGLFTDTYTFDFTGPAPVCGNRTFNATATVNSANPAPGTVGGCDLPETLTDGHVVSYPICPSNFALNLLAPFSLGFDHEGPPGVAIEYNLRVDYPDEYTFDPLTVITVTDNLSGSLTQVDSIDTSVPGEVTFYLSAHYDGDGLYSATIDLDFTPPSPACETFWFYSWLTVTNPAEYFDQYGNEGQREFYAEWFEVLTAGSGTVMENSARTVTYDNLNSNGHDLSAVTTAAENCTTMRMRSAFNLGTGTPGTWAGITFAETLGNGLRLPGGDLTAANLRIYYYAGVWPADTTGQTDLGPDGSLAIGYAAIDYTGNDLTIDLSGLDSLGDEPNQPSDGGVLVIEYDVESTSTTTPGTFGQTGILHIPDTGICIVGGDFATAASITVTASSATVGLERITSGGESATLVDDCQVLTFRLPIDSTRPWDVYDARLVLDLGDTGGEPNYEYIEGSVEFNDLLDEAGNPITAFEPEISLDGRYATWDIGDLRDVQTQDGYVLVQLAKRCGIEGTALGVSLHTDSHCANVADTHDGSVAQTTADTAVAGIGSFTSTSSASYSGTRRRGALAARFATDILYYTTGYPVLRLDIINTGSGNLYNVRLPIELGDLGNADGFRSLSFVEANVVDIEGTATGVSVGAIGTSGAIRLTDTDSAHNLSGLNGDTTLELRLDQLAPASIVTVEITTRMHLDLNLYGHITEAVWGCDVNGSYMSCVVNALPLRQDTITIRSGTTRIEIIQHSGTPDILDYCGDDTEIAATIANVGGVQAYEPVLEERLPPGLTIVPDSVEYSLNNGGSWSAFNSGPNPARLWCTSYTLDGNEEVITWNFADPNDDDNESDSLLVGAAFQDPRPADSASGGPEFFTRGRVLKPGARIQVRFLAQIVDGDCDDALAYKTGSRSAVASVIYDLPSNHDNKFRASGGAAIARSPTDPLEKSSLVSNFLDPGKAELALEIEGVNTTQGGTPSSIRVNAEEGDTVTWTVTLSSVGAGNVPKVEFFLDVPDNLSASGFTVTSPGNLSLVAGAIEDIGDKLRYNFTFDNTAFDDESYIASTDVVELSFVTVVDACEPSPASVDAHVSWGCCDGTGGSTLVSGAFGDDLGNSLVKAVPTAPVITLWEGSTAGSDSEDFTSCGGMISLQIQNPATNNELSLNALRVSFPLPSGLAYDGSLPTQFIYSGNAGRAGLEITEGAGMEGEPVVSGGTLIWAGTDNGGGIDPLKALVLPGETVTLQFYLKADDGGGQFCDTQAGSDPSASSVAGSTTIQFADSCGDVTSASRSYSFTVEAADLDISLSPDISFIDGADVTIVWTLFVKNNGNIPAQHVTLDLDFGDGYTGGYTVSIASATTVSSTAVSAEAGGPGGTDAHDLAATWTGGDSLAVGEEYTLVISRTIDTTTRGDLSAMATIRGVCELADGSVGGCSYSYDSVTRRIAGGDLLKAIDGRAAVLAEPAAPTGGADPNATVPFPVSVDSVYATADVTVGTIFREVYRMQVYEGGDNDLRLSVTLPTGLRLLHANRIDATGNRVEDLDASGATGAITFDIPNVTGGAIGTGSIFAELWIQATNNTAVAQGATLTIPATLQITRGSVVYNSSAHPGLADSTAVSVLEPFIRSDDQAKVSTPVSLADDHTPSSSALDTVVNNPVRYRFSATNAMGSSPAYEVTVRDFIPYGLGNPLTQAGGDALTVTIVEADLDERLLTAGVDYGTAIVEDPDFGDPDVLTITLNNTADAALGVGETLRIDYTAPIVAGAPGSFIDNKAQVIAYSSLPGTGATHTVGTDGGNVDLAEVTEERSDYPTRSGRILYPKYTYHLITGDLAIQKVFRSTLTPSAIGEAAGTWLTSGDGRAAIGETIYYRVRITIPAFVKIFEPRFLDTLPDGLTVESLRWEVVTSGADFTSPTEITVFPQSSGTTPIVLASSGGATDLPDDLPNTGFPNGVASEMQFLVEIRAHVDHAYNNDTAIPSLALFSNTATMEWQTVTSGVEAQDKDSNTVPFRVVDPLITWEQGFKRVVDTGTGLGTNFNYAPYYDSPYTITSVPQFAPGANVTFELIVQNEGTGSAYDLELQDFIPQGMTYELASATVHAYDGANTPVFTQPTGPNPPTDIYDGTYSQRVDFGLDEMQAGTTLTLRYRARVDSPALGDAPVPAGHVLPNVIQVADYGSLPGPDGRTMNSVPTSYSVSPASLYTVIGTRIPSVTKSVATELSTGGRATIGELLTYTIAVDVDENLSLPDFWLYDELVEGLDIVDATAVAAAGFGTPALTFTPGARVLQGTVTSGGQKDPVGTAAAGAELTVTLTASVNQTSDDGSDPVVQTDGPFSALSDKISTLANTADISWSRLDVDPDPAVSPAASYLDDSDPRPFPVHITSSPVSVTIGEPWIQALSKAQVNTTAPARVNTSFWNYTAPTTAVQVADVLQAIPGEVLEYTVTVTNSGAVPAFDVLVTDTLPSNVYLTVVDQAPADLVIDDGDVTYVGSTGSTITVTTTPLASLDPTAVNFLIDFLLPGDTATITYQATVDEGVGAGHYVGNNTAVVADYSTLPAGTLAVQVGNLTAGGTVFDATAPQADDRQRDITADTPAALRYAQPADSEDFGIVHPTVSQAIYRLFDDQGDLLGTPQLLTTGNVLRSGEVVRFVFTTTLPARTKLLDGPDATSGLAWVNTTPRGIRLRTGSEVSNFGADITGNLIGLTATSATDSNRRYRYTWRFQDIENTTTSAAAWTFAFDGDAIGYGTGATPVDLLVPGSAYALQQNYGYLFWNTTDAASQRTSLNWTINPATSRDQPYLGTGNGVALNMALAQVTVDKRPYPFDAGAAVSPGGHLPAYVEATPYTANDKVGVTGATGDSIVYVVTYSAAGNATNSRSAYDYVVTDTIPEDLRSPISAGADLSAAQFVAYIDESGGGRTVLTPDDDYDLTYVGGVLNFHAHYNTTAGAYLSKVDPGDTLVIAYKVTVDTAVGAKGGGFGQRVNVAESAWASFPSEYADTQVGTLPGAANTIPRDYSAVNAFVLELESPVISKTVASPVAGSSVTPGDDIEYVIIVPETPIRATMYNAQVVDELPDGLRFEADGTITAAASPAGVSLDLGATVAGPEIVVQGGSGAVTITVSGRTLTVDIARIDNTDSDPVAAPDDPDHDGDQVTITVKARVGNEFTSLAPIPRNHAFENMARFYWYDSTGPERVRYAALSPTVTHYYSATGILLEPSHTRTVQRGAVVEYYHLLHNFEDATRTVPLSFTTSLGWDWQFFVDSDVNDTVYSTEGPYETPHSVDVPAGATVGILMRVFVPIETAPFATDVLLLTADGPDDNDITVSDISHVRAEKVAILKEVSSDDGSTFDTRMTVDPDDPDQILQRLRVTNQGDTGVKTVYVYDFVPEGTEYVHGSMTSAGGLYTLAYSLEEYLPDGTIEWIDGAPSADDSPDVKTLRWHYTANGGVLLPGDTHDLMFKIKVK